LIPTIPQSWEDHLCNWERWRKRGIEKTCQINWSIHYWSWWCEIKWLIKKLQRSKDVVIWEKSFSLRLPLALIVIWEKSFSLRLPLALNQTFLRSFNFCHTRLGFQQKGNWNEKQNNAFFGQYYEKGLILSAEWISSSLSAFIHFQNIFFWCKLNQNLSSNLSSLNVMFNDVTQDTPGEYSN